MLNIWLFNLRSLLAYFLMNTWQRKLHVNQKYSKLWERRSCVIHFIFRLVLFTHLWYDHSGKDVDKWGFFVCILFWVSLYVAYLFYLKNMLFKNYCAFSKNVIHYWFWINALAFSFFLALLFFSISGRKLRLFWYYVYRRCSLLTYLCYQISEMKILMIRISKEWLYIVFLVLFCKQNYKIYQALEKHLCSMPSFFRM